MQISEPYVRAPWVGVTGTNMDKQLNGISYYFTAATKSLESRIVYQDHMHQNGFQIEPTAARTHEATRDCIADTHKVAEAKQKTDYFAALPQEKHEDVVTNTSIPPLTWDWTIEHEDRKRERVADMTSLHEPTAFEVDRKILKDVVREKMGIEVGRIRFLNSGTFHKAYLVTLADHTDVVARVARRFMPRLKTESEVATIHYLRDKTNVPVSTIHHYDSNPYNRLGGEFIIMSKAPGIPLSQVYHGLAYADLVKLLKNVARIILPLFAHRFPAIGSLYFGPEPSVSATSGSPTPKALADRYSAFPFSPTLSPPSSRAQTPATPFFVPSSLFAPPAKEYHVGPIISWPFFGSNRGELVHPAELNRGPWRTTQAYLASCVAREIDGVVRENEGRAAPHRLHLDPDEIRASRHHRVRAVPGDESDESDEWGLEESEDEWEGPGDGMYRDYRRMQRTTFLVAHIAQREAVVRKEMGRWMSLMQRLTELLKPTEGVEEFGLDCHDLSLENIFVDEKDHTTVTAIIDWESTTTRPLWACAHVPAFVQTSPFLTKLFREIVAQLPNDPTFSPQLPGSSHAPARATLSALADEWLYYETAGTRLRMAHRCAEWDGWEEGLVDSILGPEEDEVEWFRHLERPDAELDTDADTRANGSARVASTPGHVRGQGKAARGAHALARGGANLNGAVPGVKLSSRLPLLAEQEKEQMLNTTGDICGGRGGELGRRLEAWLSVSGMDSVNEEDEAVPPRAAP